MSCDTKNAGAAFFLSMMITVRTAIGTLTFF